MYGKIFESMYEGSLYGQWEAIVTMQQLIVLADADGVIDMTPPAIAGKTSIPLEIIEKGLKILSEPDPYSRTPDHEGIRIMLLDENRPWGWFLVNHEKYSTLKSRDDRREYMRDYMRKRREGQNVNNCKQPLAPLNHEDEDEDELKKGQNSDEFDRFWNLYGKKVKKKKAQSAFNRLNKTDRDALMAHLPERVQDPQFKNYTPDPTTFINGRLWEDEDWKTDEKKNLRDLDDRALLKLAEERGIRTQGKTRFELIDKLEAA